MEKPGLWKLEPAVVTKPWGLVHWGALETTGIKVGLGELWLASAQAGPGNYSNTVVEPALRKTLSELLEEARDSGVRALESLVGRPAAQHLKRNPHRGKTEAWHVRAVRGRTGLVAGPRSREDAERLREIIQTEGLEPDVGSWSDEVKGLFGLVEPLKGGEVFLTPAGTLHTMFASGPDSYLVIDELQQGYGEGPLPTLSKILMVQDDILSVQVHPDDATVAAAARGKLRVDQDLQANPTVRVYDFGRRPGEDPDLGFGLVDPAAGLRLVTPVEVAPAEGHSVQVMLAHTRFVKGRVRLARGRGYGILPRYGSYHALHWLEGEAELLAGNRSMAMRRGETAFVPACLEEELRITAQADCEFFDDAFPVLTVLSGFLGSCGVSPTRIEALLSPQRVLPGST
jgi:mannose-6-phosphate isomerase class I